MNDAETQLAARLGTDLEQLLGAGIVAEDVEIAGDGPVTIDVVCLVDGRPQAVNADGESAVEAMSALIRAAAELRLTAAFRQLVGPA